MSIDGRATILKLLVHGTSLRSTSEITDASINTVTKLLVAAGEACAAYHDAMVRNVKRAQARLVKYEGQLPDAVQRLKNYRRNRDALKKWLKEQGQ